MAAKPEKLTKSSEAKPLQPQSLTAYWQERWEQWGLKIQTEVSVPAFSGTAEQIAEIYQSGRKIVYIPRELTTTDGLVVLDRIFPDTQMIHPSKRMLIVNEPSEGGYSAVEDSVYAPNQGTSIKQLRELFASLGRKGMSLPTYIVASQDSKLNTGYYFDEERRSCSRLLGSRVGSDVVRALFHWGGDMYAVWGLDDGSPFLGLGARSQEEIGS